ncbi:T9SS type A sorting domain-containing protein, partial [candidate division WOR-3 bacterium]|nr:T9SS type A sorting domain-containing protein [candidate division WOR-3 bacterium]
DHLDNRLYYGQLRHSDSLKYFWSPDTGGVTWNEVACPIYDAERALDMACNEGFDSTFLFLSYYDTNDTLEIYGRALAWHRQTVKYAGAGTDYTSICAYQDTILCVFDFFNGSNLWTQYLTQYAGRAGWYFGWFDDTTAAHETPAVTGRGGGGQAAVYRFYTTPREMRFTWRRYAGNWTTPVVVADVDPYWNVPGIEYLGSGRYGVVFLSRSGPVRGAFFDRNDWTGVAEQRRLVMDENILNVVPNPLTGRGALNYSLSGQANLAVRVYDRSGRVVQRVFDGHSDAGRHSLALDVATLPPGVYFVRADAEGSVLTVPFTVTH